MKVLAYILGSRGDWTPSLTLLKKFTENGHRVVLIGDESVQDHVPSSITYISAGINFKRIIQAPGVTESLSRGDTMGIVKELEKVNVLKGVEALLSQVEDCDFLLTNIIWTQIGVVVGKIFQKPVFRLDIFILRSDFGDLTPSNRKWGDLIATRLQESLDYLRTALPHKTIEKKYSVRKLITGQLLAFDKNVHLAYKTPKVPFIQLSCFGSVCKCFHENSYEFARERLDAKVYEFCVKWEKCGKRPIYIVCRPFSLPLSMQGMGSIAVDDQVMYDRALRLSDTLDLPVILSTGWSVASGRAVDTERVLCIQHSDHEALFPICGVIIHHGGAGTTHTAVTSGVPSIIYWVLPNSDQNQYAHHLADVGVAPRTVGFKDLTDDILHKDVQRALTEEVKQNAKELGDKVQSEREGIDFVEKGMQWILNQLTAL